MSTLYSQIIFIFYLLILHKKIESKTGSGYVSLFGLLHSTFISSNSIIISKLKKKKNNRNKQLNNEIKIYFCLILKTYEKENFLDIQKKTQKVFSSKKFHFT